MSLIEAEEKKSSSKKRPALIEEGSASKKTEGRLKRRPLEKMAVFKVA